MKSAARSAKPKSVEIRDVGGRGVQFRRACDRGYPLRLCRGRMRRSPNSCDCPRRTLRKKCARSTAGRSWAIGK
jgi:hypothetical protein